MTQPAAQTSQPTRGENYVRNLCALWESDPQLALALEAVHEDDVPPLEPAREGARGGWTIRMGGAYLHSRYRPMGEAANWALAQGCDNRFSAAISGFGLGYHVKALWERMPEGALLIVAEPHLGVLKAALAAEDYSAMLASKRVLIFTALDRAQVVERLEPRSGLLLSSSEGKHYSFDNVKFVVHEASFRVHPEFHRAFQKLVVEFVAYIRTGFITTRENNRVTCRNIANNLGRYVTTPPLDLLKGAFKGKPAVLVAAGPSLAKNMHLLHELGPAGTGRRAVIVAVQTMLKPLLAAGIEPDFVTSLDYNTVSTRFFENLEESGSTGHVHLVAEAKANWNVLDVFAGSMSLTGNEFAAKLLRGTGLENRASLKAGATVAHLSFYLAEFLGCNPVILVGQDLGFVDGLYYKPGTAIHETWGVELGRFNTLETKEWERIVRSRTILRKIPDIHGHPMYTEEQFFVYLQQFERDFADAGRRGLRVIDATEGGARKQGVEVMPLRQALDGCVPPAGKHAAGPALAWKTWRCDVAAHLREAKAAFRKRREEANAMADTCGMTLPLLQQMIEHQTNTARMQDLFVEVDRLRAREQAHPQMREMVAELMLFGELERFHADLYVKLAKDNLEIQRRQLLRDMDYVSNLQGGAHKLIEILDEALVRLDRQLAALADGKPWPREVAGS